MSMMSTTMPAGCWDLDLATGALKLCPQSRKMFGLNPDSSELLTESEWVERCHPDDLAIVRQALTECLVHQTPYAERFRTIHPDGSVQLVLGVGSPVEADGEHGRFVGWNFDLMFAGDLARRWISEHPDPFGGEHQFAIVRPEADPSRAPSDRLTDVELLERARAILRVRRSRERLLGRGMIGEPAFDLLLCLYVRSGQQETSLSSLAKPAGIPYSSAMRWFAYLADKGLAERKESETDRRANSVHLTALGRDVMDELLSIR
jgi:DNA-binding MarR family transcriptional regulator